MSITPVPISIRFVRAPMAASRGKGEASCRAKWCTRKYAPSAPSSSAATARSIDCSSASGADRVADCGEGVQWPKERNPIFFTRGHNVDVPRTLPSARPRHQRNSLDRPWPRPHHRVVSEDPWQLERLDLPRYLDLVGVRAGKPDRDLLERLHEAHLRTFPFENVDVLLGEHLGVALPQVQAKFLAGGRGGYCFEHTSLFAAVLERLGFVVRRR